MLKRHKKEKILFCHKNYIIPQWKINKSALVRGINFSSKGMFLLNISRGITGEASLLLLLF